jgi:hypothetical protein
MAELVNNELEGIWKGKRCDLIWGVIPEFFCRGWRKSQEASVITAYNLAEFLNRTSNQDTRCRVVTRLMMINWRRFGRNMSHLRYYHATGWKHRRKTRRILVRAARVPAGIQTHHFLYTSQLNYLFQPSRSVPKEDNVKLSLCLIN